MPATSPATWNSPCAQSPMIWPPAWSVMTMLVAWFQSWTFDFAAILRASSAAFQIAAISGPAAASASLSTKILL